MFNQEAAREGEAILNRLRELNEEIAQYQQNIEEAEAGLPIEEQFRLNLERAILGVRSMSKSCVLG